MTTALTVLLSLFSVLVPEKMWFAPAQPINITVKSDKDVSLVLTDFSGTAIAAKGSADVATGKTVDVKTVFPDAAKPGTYILYAVAKGGADVKVAPRDFVGTPIVIEVIKGGGETGDDAVVTHVVPLQYIKMTTSAGELTAIFYYDVAPHTVGSFLQISSEGFYDGLNFHRVVPGGVIQGGDPLGTGTGGPGYHVEQEFSARQHLPGALSMARANDPNSAGSQFFICLSNEKALDNKYTVFGTVTDGFDTTVKKIGDAPVKPQTQNPVTPATINKVEVFGVTADHNPYAAMMTGAKPN